MAGKKVADAAKAKAGKQKKIVIMLGVVMALALAYAVHTMMALNGSPSALPQAAGVTVATAPTAAPAAPLPAAPTLSPSADPTAASPSSSQLVSAVRPPTGAGQLGSFSLFESKDPFNSAGPSSSQPASGSGASSGGTGSGGTSSGSGSAPAAPPAPPAAPPTAAVIAVNGVSESVLTGGAFPSTNPMFQLVSLSGTTAKVSVVGGSLASGTPTMTLTVNKPVTLQNTADGTRYTLVLMPQGTVATAAPAGAIAGAPTATPSGATAPAETTPAETTTTTGG